MTPAVKNRRSEYVQESLNDFLALWPHRYDYLYAPHPLPEAKPTWQTESNHPLSDRLIEQGSTLFGVRFDDTTRYALLDIDRGSPYHPQRDRFAIERLTEALESLGLVDYLCITSSGSGGLHLYFPFGEPLPSWQIAIAISTLLENAGFNIMPGWLEVFPNQKAFSTDGTITLYNGHRLPLQQGSYLLNRDYQPTAHTRLAFVKQWESATARNDINKPTLEQIIRESKRKTYRITGKAEKFLNNLNADIEPGWTGPGQTNFLLGRITMRSYIFGHVLSATAPLTGERLTADILRVAIALPGYRDYCGHQHEIEAKAREWAQCIEKSHYFPYGPNKKQASSDEPSWNQKQQDKARERIQNAAIDLFRADSWPDGITARFEALCGAGISGSTLYKYRDLWHPQFLAAMMTAPVETPPDPPTSQTGVVRGSALGAPLTPSGTSLLGYGGCNPLSDKTSSSLNSAENRLAEGGVRNCYSCDRKGGQADPPGFAPPPRQLLLNIRQMLQNTSARQQSEHDTGTLQHAVECRQQQRKEEHLNQLNTWLHSGDPLLEKEARRQLDRLNERKT